MARCPHKFELTQVACPVGCGGTAVKQARVGSGRVLPPPEKAPRRLISDITDEQIKLALTGAPSVRHAREKLGLSDDHKFTARCRAVPALWALYTEAKERGEKHGRVHWRRG